MERAVSGRNGGGSATVEGREWRGRTTPPPARRTTAAPRPHGWITAIRRESACFVSHGETDTGYAENRRGATPLQHNEEGNF